MRRYNPYILTLCSICTHCEKITEARHTKRGTKLIKSKTNDKTKCGLI